MAIRPITAVLPKPPESSDGSGSDSVAELGHGSGLGRPLDPRKPKPSAREAAPPESLAEKVRSQVLAWTDERREEGSSWLVSLLLHLSVVLMLWQTLLRAPEPEDILGTIVGRTDGGFDAGSFDGTELFESVGPEPIKLEAPRGDSRFDAAGGDDDNATDTKQASLSNFSIPGLSRVPPPPTLDSGRFLEMETAPKTTGATTGGKTARTTPTRKTTGTKEQPANVAGLLDGRGPEARAKLAKAGGATKESERAVNLGLDWLVRHQQSDGSWSFQHGPDQPGALSSPTGATGLALLAFLGSGNTHKKGAYISHVDRGLKFLVGSMEVSDSGGWLQGTGMATMYVQGIGTIALCEAYAMTKDETLKRPAQLAVNFICNAQDPEGGGWRYRIPQAGDTSVVGWQLMALHSARVAELEIPPKVLVKATRFLKSVESEGGAAYGYTGPENVRPSMTAVGLLCRMYLGREKTHKGMIRGMKHLSDWGPNIGDMYYSYYGTQAMHNWGDEGWQKWNAVMRDLLVNNQEQVGDAAGSWPPDVSHHTRAGGRLYTTCLCITTLEVYYRHLSLYRREKLADE